jgi:MFS family permease
MARLFGTDGVRGLANRELTADLALGLAQSAAFVLMHGRHADERRETGKRPVAVIARDPRISGEFLSSAVAAGLASQATSGESVRATQMVVEHWKTTITSSFNIGGLIGTLLTVPIARNLGRRWMFGLYFLLSAAAVLLAFGGRMPADLGTWSWLYFGIGVSVFGIFGSFTFYLPELFPTRLRGTGSGFCYKFESRV